MWVGLGLGCDWEGVSMAGGGFDGVRRVLGLYIPKTILLLWMLILF